MPELEEEDWDRVRRYKFANVKPPPDWDQSLRPISVNGTGLFALDPKGNLYWDGERIQTTVRFTRWQKFWAAVVALFAIAGGLGGAVQGWVSYHDWACRVGSWSVVACPSKSPQ